MEKQRIFAAAAAFSILAGCTACGDSDGSGAKNNFAGGNPLSGKTAVLDGKYAQVSPADGNWSAYENGIDKGLEYAIESYAEQGPQMLEFSSGSFSMIGQKIDKDYAVYSGTYTISDGKIIFNYTDYIWDGKTVNINENVPEPDMDIIKNVRRAEAVKDLPKDEQTERIRAEQLLLSKKKAQSNMAQFNETGTYFSKVAPRLASSDKAYALNILPIYTQRNPGIQKNPEIPFMLYPMDDLICVETFGMELDGGYSYGGDFTVKFDPFAPYYDDQYSSYNLDTAYRERLDKYIETWQEDDFGGSRDTTITFSDGMWKWTDSQGNLINNGHYFESREHEGLIGMYVAGGSERHDETYQLLSPLLFYIGSDGQIWYPNWVKMD